MPLTGCRCVAHLYSKPLLNNQRLYNRYNSEPNVPGRFIKKILQLYTVKTIKKHRLKYLTVIVWGKKAFANKFKGLKR